MLRNFANVNVVFDGNSLIEGVGSSGGQTMPAQVAARAPLAGSGATVVNVGVGGQTWRQMNALDGGADGDVQNAWNPSKRNVLVLLENVNTVHAGATVDQCVSDAQSYIATRRLAQAWSVVLLTSLPCGVWTSGDAKHDIMIGVDDYFRANYRKMGATSLVDLRRPGSPFAFSGKNAADFVATQPLWNDVAEWVHLSNAGYAVVAKYVADALRRLPKRV